MSTLSSSSVLATRPNAPCLALLAADAAGVRNNLRTLAAEQLSEEERASGRTEVLPVQWRKHLTLDVS